MRRLCLTSILYSFYALGERFSQGMRRRVTELGWFVLATTFVIGLSGIDTQWSLHHQIFALMLMIVLMAALSLCLSRRPRLTVQRHCPRFATAGVDLRYAVTVTYQGRGSCHAVRLKEWLPDAQPTREEFVNRPEPREKERNLFDRTFVYYRWMWLMEGKRLATGYASAEFTVHAGAPRRVLIFLRPQRRGLLALRSLRVLRREPLGLFQRAFRTHDSHDTMLILPKRYALGKLELAGRRQLDDPGSGVTSISRSISEEFAGLREYRPGDPPRHIHWRSWARLNRPVVKEYEEEHFPRFALALDTDLDPDCDVECFEEAVSVAASFVSGVETRDAVLELLFVAGQAYSFSMGGPGSSRAEEKMLELLATVQPAVSDQALEALTRCILGRAGAMSAVILVFPQWSDERQVMIESLRTRGLQCVALVISEERRAPLDGIHFLPLGEVGMALASLELALPQALGRFSP